MLVYDNYLETIYQAQ